MKKFFSSAWDWAKRIFGRSRTIFVNVIGIGSAIFMELSDSLTSFNFDDFFKHEVAVGIGLVVQVLNVLIRLDTTGPVSFKALPKEPTVEPVDDIDTPPSPKAL